MKITKSRIKQIIKEELNEMRPNQDLASKDIAVGLSHGAAAAVVNSKTLKNELSNLSQKKANALREDIQDAVEDIIRGYFKRRPRWLLFPPA